MPNPQAMRQAIRSRINSRLIVLHPEVEWVLREDIQRAMRPSRSHVIIDILPAHARQVATGEPRLWRTRGTLVFRIATPMDGGAGPAEAIAAFIAPEFTSLLDVSVTPAVRYFTPTWAPSEVPDEQWLATRLTVDWQIDSSDA